MGKLDISNNDAQRIGNIELGISIGTLRSNIIECVYQPRKILFERSYIGCLDHNSKEDKYFLTWRKQSDKIHNHNDLPYAADTEIRAINIQVFAGRITVVNRDYRVNPKVILQVAYIFDRLAQVPNPPRNINFLINRRLSPLSLDYDIEKSGFEVISIDQVRNYFQS